MGQIKNIKLHIVTDIKHLSKKAKARWLMMMSKPPSLSTMELDR